jgi:hypothetical protein
MTLPRLFLLLLPRSLRLPAGWLPLPDSEFSIPCSSRVAQAHRHCHSSTHIDRPRGFRAEPPYYVKFA